MRVIRIRCAAGLVQHIQSRRLQRRAASFTHMVRTAQVCAGFIGDYQISSARRSCQADIRLRSQRQEALFFLIGNIECSDEFLQQVFGDRLATRERL